MKLMRCVGAIRVAAVPPRLNQGDVGKSSGETGWSAYGLFRAHRYHLELNGIMAARASKYTVCVGRCSGACSQLIGSVIHGPLRD